MRATAFFPQKTNVTPKPVLEPAYRCLPAAAIATMIAFGLADLVFLILARNFHQWDTPRTEFAFARPSEDFIAVISCVLVGGAAIQSRRLLVPFVIGLLLIVASLPAISWSGPGALFKEVLPLVEIRAALIIGALKLNTLLIFVLMVRDRRRRSALGAV